MEIDALRRILHFCGLRIHGNYRLLKLQLFLSQIMDHSISPLLDASLNPPHFDNVLVLRIGTIEVGTELRGL